MGKSSDDQSATQITDIPEWARPYSRALLESTAQVAGQPYTPFEGMRTAPQNEAQKQALGLTAATALYGAPDTNAARGVTMATLGGNYTNPWSTTWNPYMAEGNPMLSNMVNNSNSQIVDNYSRAIAPQTDTAAQMAGAFGGGGHQDRITQNQSSLAKAVGDNTSNLLFQDYAQKAGLAESALTRGSSAYEAERARQMQAIQYGLGGSSLDFTAAQKLGGAGDAQNTYLQNLLNENLAEFQRQQGYPLQQLDILGGGLGKSLGGSSSTTTTTPVQGGSGALIGGALAGGLTGYGLANSFPSMFGSYGQYAPWLGAGLGALGA